MRNCYKVFMKMLKRLDVVQEDDRETAACNSSVQLDTETELLAMHEGDEREQLVV